MPKKDSLGRSLIKNRFSNVCANKNPKSFISLTEENTIDEFLNEHEMANKDFPAERLKLLTIKDMCPSEEEVVRNLEVQSIHKNKLRIPRRPEWDEKTTSDKLTERENKSFLEWKHSLAMVTEIEGIIITPYEKNLEFWRQLWRVIEKSDVVVQILDARNPLLFRCVDLEEYVNNVGGGKKYNVLLVNKADFLTAAQRRSWLKYFEENEVKVLFWSAIKEIDRIKGLDKPKNDEEIERRSEEQEDHNGGVTKGSIKILTAPELLNALCDIGLGSKQEDELVTVGLIGYPNVGKSSTINALLFCKETSSDKHKHYQASVSATPGKTKHFQTFFINKHLLLCDCPGLVMPNFVATKAEMVTNGILPVDQMTEFVQPSALVCKNVPPQVLEHTYGVMLPSTKASDPLNTQLIEAQKAYDLLGAYARVRGFMSQKGVPDFSRAARVILKDYVAGKLCYCYAPPSISEEEYGSKPPLSSKPVKVPVEKQVCGHFY